MDHILYTIIFLYGITIGSFLNVLIYRIPRGEDFVKTRSHCMECGYELRWYDLIPLGSYVALRGRCRSCQTKLSMQYPMIELANGLLYVLIFYVCGFTVTSILYALTASALLALSVIDDRTFEIPVVFNVFIGMLGLIELLCHYKDPLDYIIGFFSVSTFLVLLQILTRGRGMGGGDVKLMAVAGLLLGWKLVILAFFIGCLLGSILHITRMKLVDAGHMLAFGPYLSMGIIISMLWGNDLIAWYLQLMF